MFQLEIIIFCYNSVAKKEKRPPLRQYLMDGDFFIGAALSATLTKLVLRYADLELDVVRGTYGFKVFCFLK